MDPLKWEALARRRLPSANFYYVAGSANQGLTCAANVGAFARYRLRPRMLVDATFRDTSVEIFGQKLASPLIVAPIGVQGIVHKDGEEATARACAKLDVPMILSTAATRSIEEVAAANGNGKRWFQLYWPKPEHNDVTISLLQRAQRSGYSVLVVTVDTFALGWRPNDLDASYLPFIYGQGCQIGFSDPVFNAKYAAAQRVANQRPLWTRLRELVEVLLRPRSVLGALKILWNIKAISKSRAWLDVVNSGRYMRWDDLRILREHWPGPIVLKGVQTVDDARRAAEHGLAGIVVSNHGGRQVDGAVASLDALAAIAGDEQVKASGLTVLFDSGVRTGSDVLKALALGARGVLIGRPYIYGLAVAGQAGVEHVLKCTLADFDTTLGLIGKASVRELGRDDLEVVASA